jgi:hypothetical protein
MLGILKSSRRHLDLVGESYSAHQRFATKIGLTMITAGSAAVIHGVAPFLFQSTASRTIRRLAALIESRGTSAVRSLEDCIDVDTCAIRWAMTKARDAIAGALDGCSLLDALRHGTHANLRPTAIEVGSGQPGKRDATRKR